MIELIKEAALLLNRSRMTVALTGAGSSTPSGIPDFRSPGCGLWGKFDPVEVATIDAFLSHPAKFFEFMAPMGEMLRNAEPNPAHIALAELEKRGKLKSIITQNIDNLHQRAGSSNVIELHGNAQTAHCTKCRTAFQTESIMESATGGVPHCECGGVIKPDVVLFGEALPFQAMNQAQRDTLACDVMIVVGSSLTVAPASMLPQAALQSGAHIIVVNLQETYIDSRAHVVLREKVEIALPAILELVT
jgi:NAD-dependent deacetylase